MTSRARRVGGKSVLSVIALLTAFSPLVADWNATHLFNPAWPPHARFHDAQTMSVGLVLGIAAIPFVWRNWSSPSDAAAAAILTGAYWLSQAAAFLFPGVAWTDPELLKPGQSLDQLPLQLVGCGVIAVLILSSTAVAFLGAEEPNPGSVA